MKSFKLKAGSKSLRILRYIAKRKTRMIFLLEEMNVPFSELHRYGYRPTNPF